MLDKPSALPGLFALGSGVFGQFAGIGLELRDFVSDFFCGSCVAFDFCRIILNKCDALFATEPEEESSEDEAAKQIDAAGTEGAKERDRWAMLR